MSEKGVPHFKYKEYILYKDGSVYSTFKGGYFLKLTPKGVGYVSVTIREGKGVYKTRLAHRLTWEAFHGEIPKGYEINHKNGIKHDNRLSNLEIVTHRQNIIHAHNTGLASTKHLKRSATKIKQEWHQMIFCLLSNGFTQTDIAEMIGTSQPNISRVLKHDPNNYLIRSIKEK